ncbi:hypothetical protein D3Z42_15280 [Lachnospiraceae bacterium]|nr:hypothetical protein [Lachnospiraceae bacterium]
MLGFRKKETAAGKAAGKGMQEHKGCRRREWMAQAAILCLLVAICVPIQAQAATGAQAVTAGLKNLQNIVAAFVSSVGLIIALWGIFEWGNAMQSQDGMMQSQAFKRIGGGIVMTLGPQILTAVVSIS